MSIFENCRDVNELDITVKVKILLKTTTFGFTIQNYLETTD